MVVYSFLLFFVFICLFISRMLGRTNKIMSNIFIIISILAMAIIAGIRWGVGTDFFMYDSFFYLFKEKIALNLSLEPMFKIFCYIPGQFFSTSTVTFTLIALYIYAFIVLACKKVCKYYDLSIFLFFCFGFYFSSLNIIRQWMAISTLLYLYADIDNKKMGKKIVLITLSILSHYTSIFVIPFIIISKKIKTDKTRIIIIIVSFIATMSLNKIVMIISQVLSLFNIFDKYLYYFKATNYASASILMPLIYIIIYIFYLLFYKMKKEKNLEHEDTKLNFYINMLIFAIMFLIFGAKVDIMERMSHYFLAIIIFVVPKVYEYIKIKNNRIIIAMVVFSFGILLFGNNMKNNGGEFLPYKTIYEENIR